MGFGGALAAPSTASLYDRNLLPIGRQLWEMELMSYKTFPLLQAPVTYNLDGILKAIRQKSPPSDQPVRCTSGHRRASHRGAPAHPARNEPFSSLWENDVMPDKRCSVVSLFDSLDKAEASAMRRA
jgi:hypothetical protein